jgi:two-component system response regulator HydG
MKKARVLVIDDEPSVVDALRTILIDSGYEAVGAATAGEALEHAKTHKIDIAIVDLKLPDMSGLVALGVILDSCPEAAAVLITAHETPQVRADAIAAGFAAVLAKPFSPSALLDVVAGVLAHRRANLGRPSGNCR